MEIARPLWLRLWVGRIITMYALCHTLFMLLHLSMKLDWTYLVCIAGLLNNMLCVTYVYESCWIVNDQFSLCCILAMERGVTGFSFSHLKDFLVFWYFKSLLLSIDKGLFTSIHMFMSCLVVRVLRYL